jgi:hypothetical protein
MIDANTASYDAGSCQKTIRTIAARVIAGRPALAEALVYIVPGTDCSVTHFLNPFADQQVMEDRKYYVPDLLSDEEYEADLRLSEAADADTERLREAQGLIDEAVNLIAVLLASMEQETDARAMQAETILKIVEKKLNKAHIRVDRQETCHRNLFLAYFDLKARSEKDME